MAIFCLSKKIENYLADFAPVAPCALYPAYSWPDFSLISGQARRR